MKELGSGRYQPQVSAFFPKLGRGHSGRNCIACKTGGAKGHNDQKGNREEWEAQVGIARTSKSTRNAVRSQSTAAITALDPKQFLTVLAGAGQS
jgi:hypothetical protein